jgi:hypothetical protein
MYGAQPVTGGRQFLLLLETLQADGNYQFCSHKEFLESLKRTP